MLHYRLCVRIEALLKGAGRWDHVSADLHPLPLAGEGSVPLLELLGDALGDDIADLVRHLRVEGPELLQLEEVLLWASAASYLRGAGVAERKGRVTYSLHLALQAFCLLGLAGRHFFGVLLGGWIRTGRFW